MNRRGFFAALAGLIGAAVMPWRPRYPVSRTVRSWLRAYVTEAGRTQNEIVDEMVRALEALERENPGRRFSFRTKLPAVTWRRFNGEA